MNILITNFSNLEKAAAELDNRQLRQQLDYMAIILSAVIRKVPVYKELITEDYPVITENELKRLMIKASRYDNHPVIEWGTLPSSIILMQHFWKACKREVQYRFDNQGSESQRVKITYTSNLFGNLYNKLMQILGAVSSTVIIDSLPKVEKYKDLPPEEANKKFLLAKWKRDLINKKAYDAALEEWEKGEEEGLKPRKPYTLTWSTSRWSRPIPVWAIDELKV